MPGNRPTIDNRDDFPPDRLNGESSFKLGRRTSGTAMGNSPDSGYDPKMANKAKIYAPPAPTRPAESNGKAPLMGMGTRTPKPDTKSFPIEVEARGTEKQSDVETRVGYTIGRDPSPEAQMAALKKAWAGGTVKPAKPLGSPMFPGGGRDHPDPRIGTPKPQGSKNPALGSGDV